MWSREEKRSCNIYSYIRIKNPRLDNNVEIPREEILQEILICKDEESVEEAKRNTHLALLLKKIFIQL